jgi:hypothetical protein
LGEDVNIMKKNMEAPLDASKEAGQECMWRKLYVHVSSTKSLKKR